MRYGLDDIRGYDSIIPARAMWRRCERCSRSISWRTIRLPRCIPMNGRSPAGYQRVLQTDLLSLLNVRFVLTAPDFEMYSARLGGCLSAGSGDLGEPIGDAARLHHRQSRLGCALAGGRGRRIPLSPSSKYWAAAKGFRVMKPATISRDSGREKFIDVSIANDSWLVVSESYMPGWRAFARPFGSRRRSRIRAGRCGWCWRILQGIELPAGRLDPAAGLQPGEYAAGHV